MGTHRILLLRHARTKGNEEKRYMGMLSDEPLSDEGFKQLEMTDISRIPAFDRLFC
ncbi:MAG: histidine phosphatase family protein, partial [Lachnospiraceae bacterium]|nr:histidine phosphatase family protein [Lachnospiraceae bacterium]